MWAAPRRPRSGLRSRGRASAPADAHFPSVELNDVELPEKIGKYPVVRHLGSGATSEVYLCHDPFTERDVAVKLVSAALFNDPERGKLYRKLFVTEASLAGKMQHPHICQIFDAVADDSAHYIVMEY